VGLRVSCAVPSPVPERVRLVTEFDASLLIVTVALKVPLASGVNTMLRVVLCPAAIVRGRLGALIAKYLVETDALEIVTDAFPEFVAVTVRVLLPPALTLPKSRLAFPRVRLPLCG
jgi:hypothetical protein